MVIFNQFIGDIGAVTYADAITNINVTCVNHHRSAIATTILTAAAATRIVVVTPACIPANTYTEEAITPTDADIPSSPWVVAHM